jgi:hypothetical protein
MKKVLSLLLFYFSLNALDNKNIDDIDNMMNNCVEKKDYNCLKLGNFFIEELNKKTAEENNERLFFNGAIGAFELACDNGFGKGCGWLSIIYRGDKFGKTNIHKEQNKVLAIGYLFRGCLFEEDSCCFKIGKEYKEYNKILAVRFFKKACELGNKEGCSELSEVLK